MNWIFFGMIFILAQQKSSRHLIGDLLVLATPLPQGINVPLNPYIKYWEAARFDRLALTEANQYHNSNRYRVKRDLEKDALRPGNIIKLNFFAHDREFRLHLREDPSSIFSPDIEIVNTVGPVNYDVSRVYSGVVEDDENSHVHGVLTSDNLFDGTILTNFEQYYIEPSKYYSNDLHKMGIHSIVYKLSDVNLHPYKHTTRNAYDHHVAAADDDDDVGGGRKNVKNLKNHHQHYCASENLNRKIKNEKHKSDDRKTNINQQFSKTMYKKRKKRWLPEEMTDESQNPPLPLDLDVPYNEDFSVINSNTNKNPTSINLNNNNNNRNPILNRKNILINSYNPNSDFNLRNQHTTNRNILINNFDINNINTNNNNNSTSDEVNNNYNNNNNNINNKFNNNSRPSHKTHVEIITKNGATKKPNIIFNNYNPDVILTNSNYNNINHNNVNLNIRNDISYDNPRTAHERKSTCMLYLQADHTFFQKMGSDEASIEAITRHVQRANSIYKNTDFNGDGKPDNITFMIKRIKVHNSNALKDPSYRFPGNYGVEKFLELFSEEDYDAFCLAYMFTYRDFEMGTLGLAWTGDLKNAGGVCEKNGHYRGSLKSLNTGIVTLLNYGKHVPPAVSHVTLAHEIGHNFGSPHDPEQCTPGGEDGNFIMFARATSGDKKNNNKFSPCSLKSIEPVLNAKARSAKGCFTERQLSICGNGVVEPGEECDCGWEEDCNDQCCYPMSRHPSPKEKPCTLTPRAKCSPSQGPCCTTECSLKSELKCRDDNGCRDPSYCDGEMPQCPPSVNKPNKTICNKEFVCYMGECTGSICLAYGLESCQCIPGPNDPKTKACELCCKLPGENNQCKSSFEWNEAPFDVPDMFAKPGTPCNDYNGYCDVFQKCREVDPSGPLATLRKLLLSEESIASFKKWILSNWYSVLLIFIAAFVLLFLSAKFLGKKSNLKLKSVTIIHSATTETVRLPDDNNGVIVHTAIRSKVPLKKKVRGDRKTKLSKNQTALLEKIAKRQSNTGGNNNNNSTSNNNAASGSKKLMKKKKRVSAPVVAEEQQNKTSQQVNNDPAPIKTKKQKKSKHKEIIDYSSRIVENHTNTFGKVQKWLLESPIVASASNPSTSQIEHSSKVTQILSKSQSTPERLTQRSPKKIKSVGNLNEKVKLQVVYKPPFKFSLKLSKNNGSVKTHVVGGGNGVIGRSKRHKGRTDKNRVGVDNRPARRTALLIQSTSVEPTQTTSNKIEPSNVIENIIQSEPNYETLNPKKDTTPIYENLDVPTSSGGINTGTFRINKSASSSNLAAAVIPNFMAIDGQFTGSRHGTSSSNIKRHASISNHTSNASLNKNFSSSQNLIRSSTTNLSRPHKQNSSLDRKRLANYEVSRSSTTNLSKPRSRGSYSRRESFDGEMMVNGEKSRSRNNSINSGNLKRTDSALTGNLHPRNSSLVRGNIGGGNGQNIPRASLKTKNNLNFKRQASVPAIQQQQVLGHSSTKMKPATADVIMMSSGVNRIHHQSDVNPFEWPIPKPVKDDPLPSDLEVFVSDIENLVNE